MYCYASVSGYWVTHVATRRHVGDFPHPEAWNDFVAGNISPAAFALMAREQTEFLGRCEYALIGLPFDGQSFNDDGPAEMRARLVELRALGYRIPDYVFDDLAKEAAEGSNNVNRN